MLALVCRGYPVDHPVIQRGLAALEAFTLQLGDRLRLQSCISPVWDTALVVRALAAAGVPPDHPAHTKANPRVQGQNPMTLLGHQGPRSPAGAKETALEHRSHRFAMAVEGFQ